MRRHPDGKELFAYAEALVDGRAPIQARMAGHVTKCRRCAREVGEARATLEALRRANTEPSGSLTARILQAARYERSRERKPSVFWDSLALISRGLAAGFAISVIGLVSFRTALPADAPLSAFSLRSGIAATPSAAAQVAADVDIESGTLVKQGAEPEVFKTDRASTRLTPVTLSAEAVSTTRPARGISPSGARRNRIEQELEDAWASSNRQPMNERARRNLNALLEDYKTSLNGV